MDHAHGLEKGLGKDSHTQAWAVELNLPSSTEGCRAAQGPPYRKYQKVMMEKGRVKPNPVNF